MHGPVDLTEWALSDPVLEGEEILEGIACPFEILRYRGHVLQNTAVFTTKKLTSNFTTEFFNSMFSGGEFEYDLQIKHTWTLKGEPILEMVTIFFNQVKAITQMSRSDYYKQLVKAWSKTW